MTGIDDLQFAALIRKIVQNTGLDIAQYRDNYLRRRINTRMKEIKVANYLEYLAYLSRSPGEYKIIVDALTINVTSFFRDTSAYTALSAVLTDIFSKKIEAGRKIVRFWSVGCATGEEPYSIAMLVSEYLANKNGNFLVSITATDIDENALAIAEKGQYSPDIIKHIPKELLDKYFEHAGENYMVKNEIRKHVKFRKEDIISTRVQGYFDMIICRNVVIYFSKETHDEIFLYFHRALNRDGCLMLGKTELLSGPAKDLFIPINQRERIYRKN